MQSNQSVEVFYSINHRLSELSKTQPSIHRVRKHLREVNEKAYEPEIIAIGPYHHGKDSLKWMEDHKLRYLQLLLERRKQNVETYISAIGELEQQARDCYSEPINLSGAKFVEMLILDGCFIIELVRKYYYKDPTWNDPIFQMLWITGSLERDLILFENQIPFFVLCKLFDLIVGQNQPHELISCLLNFCSNPHSSPRSTRIPCSRISQEIKHLLDLVCCNWFSSTEHPFGVAAPPENKQSPSTNHSSTDHSSNPHSSPRSIRIPCSSNLQEIKHLLDLVYRSWFSSAEHPIGVAAPPENKQSPSTNHSSTDHPIDVAPPQNEQSPSLGRGIRFIRSATELKNANVEFHMKECDTLFDVGFKNGLMEMPSFTIEDSTECLLRNLIVYEQYSLNHQRNPVTDYTILLDCLINSSKDVEILSECKIIDHSLGSNEAVANIINRLGYLVVYDCKHFEYGNLFAEVNKHYEKGWNTSMAMLRREIFYSPWAYISFVVGVIVLVLTIVQAVCSVLERL